MSSGKVDASHSLTISAHTNLGTSPIVEFGTEEQRNRYVPLLASGKVMGGFGLTEPGAGSDAGGTATLAVKKGDHYVLNGTKNFITHGGVGEIFSVTARTTDDHGTRGITSFILTKDTCDLSKCREVGVGHAENLPKTKGFRAGKKEDKMGWRASDTRELIFEDAIVPVENVLGTVGQGFRELPQDPRRRGASASRRCHLGSQRAPTRKRGSMPEPASSSAATSRPSRASAFALSDMATEIEAGHSPPVHRSPSQAGRQAVQEGSGHGQALLLRAGHARRPPRRCRSLAGMDTPPSIPSRG
jgi:butyryl-CoA dehydrogenase